MPSIPEIRSVTGLRWFAALAVFLYHFGNPSWFPNALTNIQANGVLGVQFFFVLSGYVLTVRYFDQEKPFAQFLRSRFARIGPMYFFALALSVVNLSTSNQQIQLGRLLIHILGLQAWSRDMDIAVDFNGPAWTISVEIFFYSLFPLAIRSVHKFRASLKLSLTIMGLGISTGMLLALLHARSYGPVEADLTKLPNDYLWTSLIPLYYLGLFVSGIGAASFSKVWKGRTGTQKVGVIFQPTLATLVIVTVLILYNFNSAEHPLTALLTQFSLSAIPISWLLISLDVKRRSFVGKFLEFPVVHFLGKASFSFYILHVPAIWAIRRLAPTMRYETQFLILVVLASIAYLTVETRFRQLLR